MCVYIHTGGVRSGITGNSITALHLVRSISPRDFLSRSRGAQEGQVRNNTQRGRPLTLTVSRFSRVNVARVSLTACVCVCGKLWLGHKYRGGTMRARVRCNSENEHLRASITVNVDRCVFMRKRLAGWYGRSKLVSSSSFSHRVTREEEEINVNTNRTYERQKLARHTCYYPSRIDVIRKLNVTEVKRAISRPGEICHNDRSNQYHKHRCAHTHTRTYIFLLRDTLPSRFAYRRLTYRALSIVRISNARHHRHVHFDSFTNKTFNFNSIFEIILVSILILLFCCYIVTRYFSVL